MAPTTQADRKASAKKAAATRQRNQTRAKSQQAGTKSAATRQRNEARGSLHQAQRATTSAVKGLRSAARFAGKATISAGKSVVTQVKGAGR